jgi:predicted NUDIX family NTP pyrophosphohydrolase
MARSWLLGGHFWAKKDEGAWFIPKGEVSPAEDDLIAAKREFQEETGFEPYGNFIPLGRVKHKGGKIVHAWAFEGDCDPSSIRSNTFTIEWPPRSGNKRLSPKSIERSSFLSNKREQRTTLPNSNLSADWRRFLSSEASAATAPSRTRRRNKET